MQLFQKLGIPLLFREESLFPYLVSKQNKKSYIPHNHEIAIEELHKQFFKVCFLAIRSAKAPKDTIILFKGFCNQSRRKVKKSGGGQVVIGGH